MSLWLAEDVMAYVPVRVPLKWQGHRDSELPLTLPLSQVSQWQLRANFEGPGLRLGWQPQAEAKSWLSVGFAAGG
jgi:hypothetical protein